MPNVSRRRFVAGLAALGTGGLVLRADAAPTPEAGPLGEYGKLLTVKDPVLPAAPAKLVATEDCILGPFHRPGAPFRGKVTPPLEPGTALLIGGRVWGLDTRKPLAGARLDVWQANAVGRYDNDDPRNPPRKGVFRNRARLVADETGYYEFESIHPGAYKIGPDSWRPSHVHYAIAHPGYQTLVTQLFFKGDPHNRTDEFIKDSLIIDVRKYKVGAAVCEVGTFDIVLSPVRK